MNNDINALFDDYYKEERLKRNRKKEIKKLIVRSISIPLTIGVVTLNAQYFYDKKMKLISKTVQNPFNGCEIIIDDEKINDNYNKLKKYIDQDDFLDKTVNDMSLSEKSKQLLLYAFFSNNKINIKNLNVIKNYLCYLEDNPYSNYEETYNNLKTLFVKYNCNLPSNIAGIYIQLFNTILIRDEKDVNYAYLHELLHMDSRSGANGNLASIAFTHKYYTWFEEGSAEVLASEYRLNDETVYPVSCAAVRLLTRLLGTDVIYKARRDTHEILIDELEKKGIPRDDVITLFELLDKNTKTYDKNELGHIVKHFSKIYKTINRDEKYVEPLFIFDLNNIYNCTSIDYKNMDYYLFNKKYNNKDTVMINTKIDSFDGKKELFIRTVYKKDRYIVYNGATNQYFASSYSFEDMDKITGKSYIKEWLYEKI